VMSHETDHIVLSYNDILLRESDLAILQHKTEWINDNIISFAIEHYWRTQCKGDRSIKVITPSISQLIKSLVEVPTDIRKEMLDDVFVNSNDMMNSLIVIPVSDEGITAVRRGGSHWSLLVVNSLTKTITHLDSMDSMDSSNIVDARLMARILAQYFYQRELNTEVKVGKCPKQNNGYDCGLHVITNAMSVMSMFKGISSGHDMQNIVSGLKEELLQTITLLNDKEGQHEFHEFESRDFK